ncbi:Membrane protein insertase YidC [Desulfovibrionales bacterium]
MDPRRLLLAVALCMAVLFGWNWFFPPQPQLLTGNQIVQTPDSQSRLVTATLTPPITSTDQEHFEWPTVTVVTPIYTAVFHTNGGVLKEFKLAHYKHSIAPNSPKVDLIGSQALSKAPMGLLFNGKATWRQTGWTVSGGDLNLSPGQQGLLVFTADIDGLRLIRKFTFAADKYLIHESAQLYNGRSTNMPSRFTFTMAAQSLSQPEDKYNLTRIAFLNATGSHEESSDDKLIKGLTDSNGVLWGGLSSNFFLLALTPPRSQSETIFKAQLKDHIYQVTMDCNLGNLNPSAEAVGECDYYLGPKDTHILSDMPNNLDKAINLGVFKAVANPLLWLLHFFQRFVNNWGIAIILLTIVVKLVLYPLSYKSYKSMEQMKKLQPMLTKIRNKYKDDRQKMNEETMALYKTYKINPAGGCWPMLLQVPVFIGLYQALMNSIDLRHAAFITCLPLTNLVWLADLSVKDPFYITPIIMGATMFIQQKMTPTSGDPTQAKVMLFMPIIFTFMFLGLPSGLVLYWLVSNILSIAQQHWMIRNVKTD